MSRTPQQNQTVAKVLALITEPRSNQIHEETVLKPLYEVLSLQMNSALKCDRVKLFRSEDGNDAYGTTTNRNNPIVGANYKGKAQLHMCCVADCLSTAQEAWVLLHVARSYYFLFEQTMNADACPVTPQGLNPGAGTSTSYNQKDVDYFRTVFKKIKVARKAEKQGLADGSIEKDDRYCHWDFQAEAAQVAAEKANERPAVEAPQNNAEAQSDASDIDDDSLGGDDNVAFY